LDALFEAGCDDATIGVGSPGSIALDFAREAASAEEAVRSAIADVRTAIPGAELVEVGPDLVNLADLAEMVGCSRQNVRKYAQGEMRRVRRRFPAPVHTGQHSLYRLAEVLGWFDRETEIHPDRHLVELADVTCAAAVALQAERLRQSRDRA
jgi:hypothetical protein